MATISHSNIDENQLIQKHMGLVVQVAKSFNPSSPLVLDEYIQSGRIGLLKAIRAHDIKRGTFVTAAWYYIRWGILGYIKRECQESVLPITMDPSGEQQENITEYFPNTLSDRERDVLVLRTQGYTFKDIGEKRGYSKSLANGVFHSGVLKIRQAKETIYD